MPVAAAGDAGGAHAGGAGARRGRTRAGAEPGAESGLGLVVPPLERTTTVFRSSSDRAAVGQALVQLWPTIEAAFGCVCGGGGFGEGLVGVLILSGGVLVREGAVDSPTLQDHGSPPHVRGWPSPPPPHCYPAATFPSDTPYPNPSYTLDRLADDPEATERILRAPRCTVVCVPGALGAGAIPSLLSSFPARFAAGHHPAYLTSSRGDQGLATSPGTWRS